MIKCKNRNLKIRNVKFMSRYTEIDNNFAISIKIDLALSFPFEIFKMLSRILKKM